MDDCCHAAAALAVVDAAGAEEERVFERRSHLVEGSFVRAILRSDLGAELAEPEEAGADDDAHNEEQDDEHDDAHHERGDRRRVGV